MSMRTYTYLDHTENALRLGRDLSLGFGGGKREIEDFGLWMSLGCHRWAAWRSVFPRHVLGVGCGVMRRRAARASLSSPRAAAGPRGNRTARRGCPDVQSAKRTPAIAAYKRPGNEGLRDACYAARHPAAGHTCRTPPTGHTPAAAFLAKETYHEARIPGTGWNKAQRERGCVSRSAL